MVALDHKLCLLHMLPPLPKIKKIKKLFVKKNKEKRLFQIGAKFLKNVKIKNIINFFG